MEGAYASTNRFFNKHNTDVMEVLIEEGKNEFIRRVSYLVESNRVTGADAKIYAAKVFVQPVLLSLFYPFMNLGMCVRHSYSRNCNFTL